MLASSSSRAVSASLRSKPFASAVAVQRRRSVCCAAAAMSSPKVEVRARASRACHQQLNWLGVSQATSGCRGSCNGCLIARKRAASFPPNPPMRYPPPAQACTIIGGGRVGEALAAMGPGTDVSLQTLVPPDTAHTFRSGLRRHSMRNAANMHPPSRQVIVRRGGKIEGPPGPIIVATRNDALDGIVDATPEARRKGERRGPAGERRRRRGALQQVGRM
jgi:hypothetical protein